jgi:hypothetical protein
LRGHTSILREIAIRHLDVTVVNTTLPLYRI